MVRRRWRRCRGVGGSLRPLPPRTAPRAQRPARRSPTPACPAANRVLRAISSVPPTSAPQGRCRPPHGSVHAEILARSARRDSTVTRGFALFRRGPGSRRPSVVDARARDDMVAPASRRAKAAWPGDSSLGTRRRTASLGGSGPCGIDAVAGGPVSQFILTPLYPPRSFRPATARWAIRESTRRRARFRGHARGWRWRFARTECKGP